MNDSFYYKLEDTPIDRKEYQRKEASTFLNYALLIGLLGTILIAQMWLFWDKIMHLMPVNPVKAFMILSAGAVGVFTLVFMVPILLFVRWVTLMDFSKDAESSSGVRRSA